MPAQAGSDSAVLGACSARVCRAPAACTPRSRVVRCQLPRTGPVPSHCHRHLGAGQRQELPAGLGLLRHTRGRAGRLLVVRARAARRSVHARCASCPPPAQAQRPTQLASPAEAPPPLAHAWLPHSTPHPQRLPVPRVAGGVERPAGVRARRRPIWRAHPLPLHVCRLLAAGSEDGGVHFHQLCQPARVLCVGPERLRGHRAVRHLAGAVQRCGAAGRGEAWVARQEGQAGGGWRMDRRSLLLQPATCPHPCSHNMTSRLGAAGERRQGASCGLTERSGQQRLSSGCSGAYLDNAHTRDCIHSSMPA